MKKLIYKEKQYKIMKYVKTFESFNDTESVDDKRINDMVDHWRKYHWAKSHVDNKDSKFFDKIGLDYDEVGISSFTGNDIEYYDTTKVKPHNGSMIPI